MQIIKIFSSAAIPLRTAASGDWFSSTVIPTSTRDEDNSRRESAGLRQNKKITIQTMVQLYKKLDKIFLNDRAIYYMSTIMKLTPEVETFLKIFRNSFLLVIRNWGSGLK